MHAHMGVWGLVACRSVCARALTPSCSQLHCMLLLHASEMLAGYVLAALGGGGHSLTSQTSIYQHGKLSGRHVS
jgi:hypothetical protein